MTAGDTGCARQKNAVLQAPGRCRLAEWKASQPSEQEVLDQIKAKLRAMRERQAAATALLDEHYQTRADNSDHDHDLGHDDPNLRYPPPDRAMLPPRPAWMSGPAPTQTDAYQTPLDRLDGPQQWVIPESGESDSRRGFPSG